MTDKPAPKKKKLSFFKKIILGILLAIILLFVLDQLGIPIGKISEDTEIIDPYQGR
ncbi:MAG: hypothetical protein Sapg2KO_39450 [Saprospiraceae bacterium]